MVTKQSVLIELDALLDTRLATISKIDQAAAVTLLKSETYYTRVIDDFTIQCGIDKATFDAAYVKRDIDTLKRARPTNCTFCLKDVVKEMVQQTIDTPFFDEVEIVINVWPYKLTPAEKSELCKIVLHYTYIRVTVACIDLSPGALTPQYIKDNFVGIIMYHFAPWAELHGEGLVTHQMPDITFLAPAMYKDRIPNLDEVQVQTLPGIDPFALTEFVTAQCIALNLIDVGYFCIAPPSRANPVTA